MTVDYSRDLMIGMLRKGATGNQILQILDVIVPNQTETDNNTVSANVINA
jgi:hypothetical protein